MSDPIEALVMHSATYKSQRGHGLFSMSGGI